MQKKKSGLDFKLQCCSFLACVFEVIFDEFGNI